MTVVDFSEHETFGWTWKGGQCEGGKKKNSQYFEVRYFEIDYETVGLGKMSGKGIFRIY